MNTREAREALALVLDKHPNTDAIALVLGSLSDVTAGLLVEQVPGAPGPTGTAYGLKPLALIDIRWLAPRGDGVIACQPFLAAKRLGIDRFMWVPGTLAKAITHSSLPRYADVLTTPVMFEIIDYYRGVLSSARRLGVTGRVFERSAIYVPLDVSSCADAVASEAVPRLRDPAHR